MDKRIWLSLAHMSGREQDFINEAFATNWVVPLGPNVNAFEKEMAEYTGCGYAAALSAGTAAIHLALRLIGIQPGDVVFSSDLTFSATCNPICYEKAELPQSTSSTVFRRQSHRLFRTEQAKW